MVLNDLTTCGGFFTDETGKPLAGGLLVCYVPGTTIPKALYAADGTSLGNVVGVGSDGFLTLQAYLGDGVNELQLYAPNFDGAVYDPDDFPGSDWRLVRSWNVRGSSASGALPGIGSVAALQALDASALEEGAVVAVSGYYASGDCPTRLFTLRDGTATGNGGTIFPALGGGRYWEWEPQGDVDVRTFGAVPGSNEDAVPSLISATAYANGADVDLWFLPGIYKVSSASLSVDGVKIEDGVSFLVEDAGDSFVLSVGKRYDIRLTGSARNASSAGKAKLDFSTCTASGKVHSSWNSSALFYIDWVGAQTLVLENNITLLENDLGVVEVKANALIGCSPVQNITIGEIRSVGGKVSFVGAGATNHRFYVNRLYTSALAGIDYRAALYADVFVDADIDIKSFDDGGHELHWNNCVFRGVPGGALITAYSNSVAPALTLGGVVSNEVIFATPSLYVGGGSIDVADSSKPVRAHHFATLDDDAVYCVARSNSNKIDLEGLSASITKALNYAYSNGSISIAAGLTFGNVSFDRCKISGGFTVSSATFSLVDCTTDAQIVLVGGIAGFVATGNTYTGAGAALDASGVTSWTGHAQVSGNSPEAVTRSLISGYWPQTEGAVRANPSGGASSSVNFGDGGTPHPGILYTGTTDAVLIPSSTFGRAVKVSGSTATNIKVETVDGSSFASGDIVSVYFNYSR